MNPAHHLERSRHYLNFVPGNISAGDYNRAAKALTRAAGHAATAAAVHWHHGHYSRRRLTTALFGLVYEGRLAHSHLRAFRDVYQLPQRIAASTPAVARRLLRRFRRQVSRLIAAIASAMAGQPNVPTMQQLITHTAPASPGDSAASLTLTPHAQYGIIPLSHNHYAHKP